MSHVCPWWLAYTFDNVLRRVVHNPRTMLGPYVGEGMTALDVGCGMGFFSIGMANLVGDGGRVIAADLQQQMLDVTTRRAKAAGVAARVTPHLCAADRMGIEESADFALAFWMVHEVPDPGRFMGELQTIVRPGGSLLIVEPRAHVSRRGFARTVSAACDAGFEPGGQPGPRVCFSRAQAFRRSV